MIFRDLKIKLLTPELDRIAEVRDEETGELIDHMWAPQPHSELDLTPYVVSFEIRPEDLDE